MPSTLSVLALPLLSSAALAANLYASHFGGTVSLLKLEGSEGDYSLTETSSVDSCGQMPSWITWDSANRMLYCSDEGFTGQEAVHAFSADESGALTKAGSAPATSGALANNLYGGGGFLISAYYSASTVSTHKLPLADSSGEAQTFTYELDGPGTDPSRQDAPHPHGAHVDPTSSFMLVPDLGADILRTYTINQDSGELTECPDFTTAPGDGPRHAVFWTAPAASSRVRRQEADTFVFVANELSNTVSSYSVSIADGCPTFTLGQKLTAYASNETAPEGTKVAEIKTKGSFLYLSSRNDEAHSPNGSIAQYTISASGEIAFEANTDSHTEYPRTFDINDAGDLVAISGRTSANVAIVTRDTSTGALGDVVAELKIGSEGNESREDGLSAVVWAE